MKGRINMKNIAIIGSGSWGVALAMYLESIGNKVKIWSFDKSEADLINNDRKCKFLPNITIPDGVSCSLSYEEVIENIYHTFITEDDYEIPRIEAIEAFLNREDIIEEVNKDLYFEV